MDTLYYFSCVQQKSRVGGDEKLNIKFMWPYLHVLYVAVSVSPDMGQMGAAVAIFDAVNVGPRRAASSFEHLW